eukprot:10150688-Karenia_brevis.AAC.1
MTLAAIWPEVKRCLAEAGHVLNVIKSEIWIPGCDQIDVSVMPEGVRDFCMDIKRAYGGITIMGSAAQG